jgi:hypothetical protein
VSEGSSERSGGLLRRRTFGAVPSGLAEASPTWELELLLSGAVLVALFQASGVIDRAFDRMLPHTTRAAGIPLFFAYWYGKAMVAALIATFVVHLASRGYWVGLVGLNSVFPGGVRWDELRYGPHTREVMRERLPSLPSTIARIDNFCSALFSFGFLVALFFAISLVVFAIVGGVAYAIAALVFRGRGTLGIFYVVLGALALVPTVGAAIDRSLGKRLDPQTRRARALRRVAVASYWTSGMPLFGPIYLTLASNTHRQVFGAVFFTVFFGVLAFVGIQFFVRLDILSVNNYAYFAQPDRFSVNASHYETQRRRDEMRTTAPTIQSDVIRDPFVKLFIPYSPERHNRAIATACPDAKPLQPLGLQFSRDDIDDQMPDSAVAPVLRCFAKLHPVTLNGTPLTDLEFRFHTNPSTSLRGIIAYIPTAGLPRGRNVLTVQPVARTPRRGRPRPPAPVHVIPFWL